jgi:hypothetical protein
MYNEYDDKLNLLNDIKFELTNYYLIFIENNEYG